MDNSRIQDTQGYKINKTDNNIIDFPISNLIKEDTLILGNTPILGIPTSNDYKAFDTLDSEYFINRAKKRLYGNNPPEGLPTPEDFKGFESLDVEYFVNQAKKLIDGTGKSEDIQFNGPNRERIRKEIAEDLKYSSPQKSLSNFFGFKK
ncbi:hypothetical protein [Bacillus toyonensis]|uniref:hypothetical protein n=1 Tax=Bacillus toyonensis TaxID=155322 RepID=UPI002E1D2C74|nr:hypothetical protein [Bacillus toyonensis]